MTSHTKQAERPPRLAPSSRVYLDRAAMKAAIAKAGMTTQQLAREIDVHRSLLSHWVNGTRQPTRDQAAILAWVLRVKIEEIAEDPWSCPHCGGAVAA